jgi:hypothetical protein
MEETLQEIKSNVERREFYVSSKREPFTIQISDLDRCESSRFSDPLLSFILHYIMLCLLLPLLMLLE